MRFIAESSERTRVELEHRHLERHGDGWEGVRAGVDGNDGWRLYLRRYAELLARRCRLSHRGAHQRAGVLELRAASVGAAPAAADH